MGRLLVGFALFMQFGALWDMPRQCFTARNFLTCERVQVSGWVNRYDVDWTTVNAIRSFEK